MVVNTSAAGATTTTTTTAVAATVEPTNATAAGVGWSIDSTDDLCLSPTDQSLNPLDGFPWEGAEGGRIPSARGVNRIRGRHPPTPTPTCSLRERVCGMGGRGVVEGWRDGLVVRCIGAEASGSSGGCEGRGGRRETDGRAVLAGCGDTHRVW